MAYDTATNTEKMRRYRANLRAKGLNTTDAIRFKANRRMREWHSKWKAAAHAALGR